MFAKARVFLKDIGENTIADTFAVFLPGEAVFLAAKCFKTIAAIHEECGEVDWVQVWNAMSES
jgi:hypothetical protein